MHLVTITGVDAPLKHQAADLASACELLLKKGFKFKPTTGANRSKSGIYEIEGLDQGQPAFATILDDGKYFIAEQKVADAWRAAVAAQPAPAPAQPARNAPRRKPGAKAPATTPAPAPAAPPVPVGRPVYDEPLWETILKWAVVAFITALAIWKS